VDLLVFCVGETTVSAGTCGLPITTVDAPAFMKRKKRCKPVFLRINSPAFLTAQNIHWNNLSEG
jgi:hypothetical protein